jgi:hypothetical protein
LRDDLDRLGGDDQQKDGDDEKEGQENDVHVCASEVELDADGDAANRR